MTKPEICFRNEKYKLVGIAKHKNDFEFSFNKIKNLTTQSTLLIPTISYPCNLSMIRYPIFFSM